MSQIYLVKDVENIMKKPFIIIHRSRMDAEQKVNKIRNQEKEKANLKIEAIAIKDYDQNKNSLYVIYDKSDKNFKSPVVNMFFDFKNAENALSQMRKGMNMNDQKMIFARMENIV